VPIVRREILDATLQQRVETGQLLVDELVQLHGGPLYVLYLRGCLTAAAAIPYAAPPSVS
jgi:hypothetical protein